MEDRSLHEMSIHGRLEVLEKETEMTVIAYML